MKKLILAAFAITCAASVMAQGTIAFQNNLTGTFASRVWAYNAADPFLSLTGNSPADTPAGTTDYLGAGMLRVGAAGATLAGPTTFAQLLSAPGANAPEASLVPQAAIVTFRTGSAAGVSSTTTATLSNVDKDAAVASFRVFAWDNAEGIYANYETAFPAWQACLIAGGFSPQFNVEQIGGDVNTPPFMTGWQSFNLYFIPEPSSMVLAGLGAAALLIFRRRS